jgi:hypothetical protein
VSAAVVIAIAVGISTTLLLIVLLVALVRHLKVLTRALRRYQDEVQPLLEQIQAESEAARTRAEDVPSRLPARGPGARLRKSS